MTDGDVRTVRRQGRLDSAASPRLQRDWPAHIDAGARSLLIDFSDVPCVSIAGLRTVGWSLAQGLIHEHVAHVLDLSGVGSIFDVQPSPDAARARPSRP
jgi:anti-anti-sigma regulatory factor